MDYIYARVTCNRGTLTRSLQHRYPCPPWTTSTPGLPVIGLLFVPISMSSVDNLGLPVIGPRRLGPCSANTYVLRGQSFWRLHSYPLLKNQTRIMAISQAPLRFFEPVVEIMMNSRVNLRTVRMLLDRRISSWMPSLMDTACTICLIVKLSTFSSP